jgi:hypothetical protein
VTLRRRRKAIAVVVHHSVTATAGRTDLEQAQDVEAAIYGRRFGSRFSMVAYSWLLSTGARLYEGRGLKYRNGANNDSKGTGYTNANTLSVVLCGNYHDGVPGLPALTPTEQQARMLAELILDLIRRGELVDDPHVTLIPHRHVHATACPGSNVVGAWLARVRELVAERLDTPEPVPTPPSSQEDTMQLIRFPAGYGALDWIEHGGTISALTPTSADRLMGLGVHRVTFVESDLKLLEGLRARWRRHGILDESTGSATWVDLANAVGLDSPGMDST